MIQITHINVKKYLIIIALCAFAVRLLFVIFNDPIPPPELLNLDDVDFNYLGWQFGSGQGLTDKYGDPTSTRFPLYPVFLGIIYFIFGWHSLAAYIIQAIIGAITPIIVYFIAREFFDRKISLIAACITALYPSYIAYSGRLMTENLFLPELALFILLAIRMRRNYTLLNAVSAGGVLGLACLTRGVIVPMILLIPIYAMLAGGLKEIRVRIKNTIFLILTLGLVLGVWVIRNYVQYDRFMLTSSSAGPVLWMSFSYLQPGSLFKIDRAYAYVDSVGREHAKLEEFHTILVEDNQFGIKGAREVLQSYFPDREFPQSEADINKMFMEEVVSMIKAHPEMLLLKTIREFLRFWHFLDDRGKYVISYGLILPFFLWGLWVLRRRLFEIAPLLAFFLYSWGMETAIMSAARFRMPFEVVMIVIGAFGIYWIYAKLKPVAVPIVLSSAILGINLYLNYNVSTFRNIIRATATAVGIQVSGTDERYVPHLNGVDTLKTESNIE